MLGAGIGHEQRAGLLPTRWRLNSVRHEVDFPPSRSSHDVYSARGDLLLLGDLRQPAELSPQLRSFLSSQVQLGLAQSRRRRRAAVRVRGLQRETADPPLGGCLAFPRAVVVKRTS